ncbi:MAG: LysR family transcriptional regulator [Proteobacteria bacterium]|nr:LysR family transcriptional regulator [Pseudomonadota bacterium]MBU1697269.1 LysR family transcriptional regulator [Pseudomonadota bacterium]
MNLNQLKLFYLAVKHKNLSHAAEELNITQPAVSKGIQRLQEYYEMPLVHNLGKNMELTLAGATSSKLQKKYLTLKNWQCCHSPGHPLRTSIILYIIRTNISLRYSIN